MERGYSGRLLPQDERAVIGSGNNLQKVVKSIVTDEGKWLPDGCVASSATSGNDERGVAEVGRAGRSSASKCSHHLCWLLQVVLESGEPERRVVFVFARTTRSERRKAPHHSTTRKDEEGLGGTHEAFPE